MTTDALYRTAVEERYRMLRAAIRIARRRHDWGLRLGYMQELQTEIRALVRIRWFVRRAARADAARRAAVLNLPYHDWQSLPEAINALNERDLFQGYGLRLR